MSSARAQRLQALVLVGGQGTRLRPLTYDIPKPMLPIAGRPIIARILEWLASYGVERAVLSLGYRPEPFMEAFPKGEVDGVLLDYAVEPEPLDTAGAIRFAASHAGILDEGAIVVNGDILTDLDLDELIEFYESRGTAATIALTPVADPSAYGVVETTDDGTVSAFVEKPAPGESTSNLINAGTYVLSPAALATIPEGRVSIERVIFPALVAEGRLSAMSSTAYWIDTGTPERYRQAQLDVLRGVRTSVHLGGVEEISAGVFAEPGARLLGEASGRVLLGRDCLVSAGAVIADSVLGEDVQVGADAKVTESVLLAGARIEAGALIEASIVGPGAVIGSGALVSGDSIVAKGAEVRAQARLQGTRWER